MFMLTCKLILCLAGNHVQIVWCFPARDMTRNPIETDPRKYDLNEIGGAGVDSGQISVMGDKVAKQWSKPGPRRIIE